MRRCVGPLTTLLLIITSIILSTLPKVSHATSRKPAATVHVFKPEDFIVVINTEQTRLQLALASRPLRAGLRTFIVIDNATLARELNETGHEHNETYAFFPNRNITGPERSKPGDTRWQAAPFMAHHHFGPTYKWILLGDDDTLWFMMGVKRLLYGYNHDLPYAISDHMGDHNARGFFVPSPLAAVCSPCHWLDLLRAHHREDLLPYSSAVRTQQEISTWDPQELDGWGLAAGMRLRKRPGGGANGTASSRGGARQRTLRGPWARRRGAAVVDGSAGGSGSVSGTSLQHPPWSHRGQEAVNVTQLLHVAYYSTAPGFEALGGGDGGDGTASATPQRLPLPIPPPGCPCRPAQGCLQRARVCRGRGRGQELCGRTLVFKIGFRGNGTACRHSWAHGGAGVVLSVGLLRVTSGGAMEACARAAQVHSCDMNLAMCLMNPALGLVSGAGVAAAAAGAGDAAGEVSSNATVARRVELEVEEGGGRVTAEDGGVAGWGAGAGGGGFMFTHPGSAVLRGANWADPRFILFDNPVYQRVLHDPVGFLEGRVGCGRDARDLATARVAAQAAGSRREEVDEEVERGEIEGGPAAAAAEEEEPETQVGGDGSRAGRRLLSSKGMGGEVGLRGAGGHESAPGAGDRLGQQADKATAEVEAVKGAETCEGSKLRAVVESGTSPRSDLEGVPGPLQAVGRTAARALRKARQERANVAGVAAKKDKKKERQAQPRTGGGVRRPDGDLDVDDDGGICAWLVRHAVSLHMHGRSYASYDDAATAMDAVVRRHLLAVRRLRASPQT